MTPGKELPSAITFQYKAGQTEFIQRAELKSTACFGIRFLVRRRIKRSLGIFWCGQNWCTFNSQFQLAKQTIGQRGQRSKGTSAPHSLSLTLKSPNLSLGVSLTSL